MDCVGLARKLGSLLASIALTIGIASATEVTYRHDAQGRVDRATYSDHSYVEYTYDANGNRTKAEFFSIVDISPPSAPGNPTFSAITVTTATVEWTIATDNVGVINYEWSRDGGLSWNWTGLNRIANLTGLSEATLYTVLVRASDVLGNTGPNSSASFTTQDITPPGPPGAPTFSSLTATSVVANWTPASDNLRVASYEWSRDSGATWTTVAEDTSASISGLSPVTLYTIRIRARDGANLPGPYSAGSFTTNNVPDTEPPSATGIPQINSITATTANASWAPATDNVNVASYEWLVAGTLWASVTTTSVPLSGLTGSTEYTFRVRARDGAGLHGPERSSTFTTSDITRPNPPGIPGITSITGTSAVASWTAATDNIGVTGYEYSRNGGTSYTDVPTNLTVTLSGLTQYTEYTVHVRAYDAAGNRSDPTSAIFRTRDTQAPSPPGVPQITALTGTSATVSWAQAGDNVGVTRYVYSIDNWATPIDMGLSTSVNLTSLSQVTLYNFQVRAYDAANNPGGVNSAPFTTLDATPPGMPGTPTFSLPGSSSVTVSWTSATDNVAVASYEYSINNGNSWTNVGSALSVNVTGLSGGTSYPVWVRARDSSHIPGTHSASSFTTFASITVGYREVLNTTGFPVSRAEFQLTAAGDIMVSASSGFAMIDVGDWLSPKTGMSGFEVRVTSVSSQLCEGHPPVSTWVALTNTFVLRTAASGMNPPASTCAATYQIRHSSSPAVILGSGETYLRADH
jgi:chitodextrinase